MFSVLLRGVIIQRFAKTGRNFTVLTGPNQSGKSIYIRQIALLQIMAQIGCFVPAREATFKPTNRIFSRIGFDDSIESNACSLMVEMRDIQYMKQNMTSDSIVIIDELCRGTSVEEGTNLAFAISEELLDSSAFVFFTTHYLLLTKLEDMYPNVVNFHFEAKSETSKEGKTSTRFTHSLKSGATMDDSYGLRAAELTSFPKEVLTRAKEISSRLCKTRKPDQEVHGLLARYQLSLRLKEELTKIGPGNDPKPLIRQLQKSYSNLPRTETMTGEEIISTTSSSGEVSLGRGESAAGKDKGRKRFSTVWTAAERIKRKYKKLDELNRIKVTRKVRGRGKKRM